VQHRNPRSRGQSRVSEFLSFLTDYRKFVAGHMLARQVHCREWGMCFEVGYPSATSLYPSVVWQPALNPSGVNRMLELFASRSRWKHWFFPKLQRTFLWKIPKAVLRS
jgi:hypothetical protein